MATAYATNDAKAVSETLDGETIVIHMETGNYYSLNGTGSFVWGRLKGGRTLDALAADLAGAYNVTAEAAAGLIATFLSMLVVDGLVLEQDGAPADAQTPSDTDAAPAGERQPFEAPLATRYDDMQEMLLADPIHDVDEQHGWPMPKQPS